MAKVVFKSYNPNDNLLLPPCLGDYLPQNHPARVVSAMIDRLDIGEIESGYVGGGTSSYNPRMLLKVIVYAYLNNVYSGRQMEKLLVENIAYMWLSGMQTPDFRTINLFRSKRLAGKFDDIKQNHGFNRFRLKSNTKVKVEFGLVALAHNLRKYIAVERLRSKSACSCL